MNIIKTGFEAGIIWAIATEVKGTTCAAVEHSAHNLNHGFKNCKKACAKKFKDIKNKKR